MRTFLFSAAESKEKWRNLRNSFVKNIKPPASGAGKKKTYYLSEAMKFALPFVKIVSATSGNLPEVPDPYPNSIDAINEESEFVDQPESQSSASAAAQPTPVAFSTPSHGEQNKSKAGKKRKATFGESDHIAEYFLAKKKYVGMKQQAKNAPKQSEALKMFLLSLLLDLETLPPTQVRVFKRKTLALIEELISTTSTISAPSRTSISPLLSPASYNSYSSSQGELEPIITDMSPIITYDVQQPPLLSVEDPPTTNDNAEPTVIKNFFQL